MVLSYVSVIKLKNRPKMESLERLTAALLSEFSEKDASVPVTQVRERQVTGQIRPRGSMRSRAWWKRLHKISAHKWHGLVQSISCSGSVSHGDLQDTLDVQCTYVVYYMYIIKQDKILPVHRVQAKWFAIASPSSFREADPKSNEKVTILTQLS